MKLLMSRLFWILFTVGNLTLMFVTKNQMDRSEHLLNQAHFIHDESVRMDSLRTIEYRKALIRDIKMLERAGIVKIIATDSESKWLDDMGINL